MTTGRINQVTILSGRPEPNATPRGRQSCYSEKAVCTAARGTPEQGYTGLAHYPIAPTEFPTGQSATLTARVLGTVAACNMCPAGGGYRSQVTSEDGYLLRLTPECLKN